MITKRPYLSVVICTLNRYDDVLACLEALFAAAKNTDVSHETIVIDQTAHPDRRDDLTTLFPSIKHIHQDETGLSTSRNLGIRKASGDIIAFLDDDAIPCLEWFTEIAAPFQEDRAKRILACGGKVVADYRKGIRPDWMTRALENYLSCVDWGETSRWIEKGEWIVGANMAFRRQVFKSGHMFNVALGRNGGKTLLSNEETSLFEQIGTEHIWYSASALVNHVISPERLEQKWFRRRVYWQGISDLIADSVWTDQDTAWLDVTKFIAASKAERRSLIALFHDCEDSELFALQLKAIYGLTILGSGGFCIPE